jgi:hypothetical protein
MKGMTETVRTKLANAFPDTRFFVSRDKAGFGTWYWMLKIRWVEGPTFEEVRAVTDEMQKTGIAIRCQRDRGAKGMTKMELLVTIVPRARRAVIEISLSLLMGTAGCMILPCAREGQW